MRYSRYGQDGPEVSALGFGVMRLPPRRQGEWGSVNFTRSIQVLRAALEAGVNFFDTHHNYHNGLSEEAIGRALKGQKRPVVIQTKTPFYKPEPLKYFQVLVEQALVKLGVGCIDYLLFHSMDMKMFTQRGKGFLKLTDWAMKKGYIRRRGFSSHDSVQNIKAFVDTGEFSAMLVSFNWLNPYVEEAIAYAAGKGMGVSVMNPLAGGMLSAETAPIRRLLPAAAASAEIGLRYVLSTPGVNLALSGMNAVEQVEQNAATASLDRPMTPAQRRAFVKRLDRLRLRGQRICTACGYCMPCPHGVNIPENFQLLNRARLFGLLESGRERFARLTRRKDGDHSARACRRCGACLPKCPNKVPIIRQLEQTAKLLGA